jgi:hypothetical protein
VGGGGGDAGVQGCQALGGRVTCWKRAPPVALLGSAQRRLLEAYIDDVLSTDPLLLVKR